MVMFRVDEQRWLWGACHGAAMFYAYSVGSLWTSAEMAASFHRWGALIFFEYFRMLRQSDYIILFVVSVLLQLLVFNNIQVSGLVSIYVYMFFIIVLPVSVRPWALLLLATLLGVTVDFFSGTAGLSTMSTLFMAFMRPSVIRLTSVANNINADSAPVSGRVGNYKFIRYALAMVALHNIAYFMLEALSVVYWPLTLFKTAIGTVLSVTVIYFCQLPLVRQKDRF